MKKKFISLALAVMVLLSISGCAMSTPASVGSIGGVDIPAGIYLLAQYNAYNTAAGVADLATGETANDVKAVLKAQCTGTIGDEEVTTDGADYVSRLTLRSLQYYAAVEKKFDELGGTLEDAATSEAAQTADSLWESNGDLYTANGISKSSLETYLLNSQKAQACLELIYGENGTEPVSTQDYSDYIADNCYYLETVQLPLFDQSTYAYATEDQKQQVSEIADECRDYLAAATSESALYLAAMQYVPEAFTAIGSSTDSSQALYYAASGLYTPDDLASYDDGTGNNTLINAVEQAGFGQWTTVDLGLSYVVVRAIDPLEYGTVDEYVSNYNLLDAMKSSELQNQLYAEGASMENGLSASAMKTYSASKIKKTV
ncbi:MAG: hypothetical protein U0L91_05885 [Gemmiger sp.]|uniref:hypothetical protein n=1 Tax=Gemmiger sp. TaxID=2049027 RepID=UPI002E76BAC9|nr:hypothetical protein [Gemmiger sp.]MEE0800793.1 hypothetical protein [Gemmiger sp.]